MKLRPLNSTKTFKFPRSRRICTGVLSKMSAAAVPVVGASETFGRGRLKEEQFASQHPTLSQRWQPNSRCNSRHRALPGAVLMPNRKHHTHGVVTLAVDVEDEDDVDASAPSPVGIHVNAEEREGVSESL